MLSLRDSVEKVCELGIAHKAEWNGGVVQAFFMWTFSLVNRWFRGLRGIGTRGAYKFNEIEGG